MARLKVAVRIKLETEVEIEVDEDITYMEAQVIAADTWSDKRDDEGLNFGDMEEKVEYKIPMKAWKEALNSR